MDDLISRQAAIDALCAVCGNDCDKSIFVYNAPQDEQVILCPEHYCLCMLPSVQPEPKWIPCSETVDIPDHEILACDKYGEMMFGYLAYEDEQWLCESDECIMYDAMAWREKPEPYREEGEQE